MLEEDRLCHGSSRSGIGFQSVVELPGILGSRKFRFCFFDILFFILFTVECEKHSDTGWKPMPPGGPRLTFFAGADER